MRPTIFPKKEEKKDWKSNKTPKKPLHVKHIVIEKTAGEYLSNSDTTFLT